jgi:hypothetical protein
MNKLQTLKEKPELAIFDELISLNGKINSIKSIIKDINLKEVKTYEEELEKLSGNIFSLQETLQGKDMVVNVDFDSIIGSLDKVEQAIKNIKEVKIPEFPKSIGLDEVQINELLLAINTIPEFPIEDLSKMFKSLEKRIEEFKIEFPEQELLDYDFLDNKFRSLEKAVKNISITVSSGGGGIGERANENLDTIATKQNEIISAVKGITGLTLPEYNKKEIDESLDPNVDIMYYKDDVLVATEQIRVVGTTTTIELILP